MSGSQSESVSLIALESLYNQCAFGASILSPAAFLGSSKAGQLALPPGPELGAQESHGAVHGHHMERNAYLSAIHKAMGALSEARIVLSHMRPNASHRAIPCTKPSHCGHWEQTVSLSIKRPR
jgi:hypothetical protein